MLEVIEKGREAATHSTPLLFVHGALHGAWCWDEYFLDYFAAQGFHALALNLRGHGASSTTTPLRNVSLADFVDDVATVADGLPAVPVVIGHSLGGFVVQKYLESHVAPAAVLFASAPPTGGRGVAFRASRRYPWLNLKSGITAKSLPVYGGTPKRSRSWFFSADMPEALVEQYTRKLQEESSRAAIQTLFHRPRPDRINTPILVIGAGNDNLLSAKEVRATASTYGVEAHIVPDIAHDMMLESNWRTAADPIVSWLHELDL